MQGYDRLVAATQAEQGYLFKAPIIGQVASGSFELATYIEFLTNAYHHVKFTVPLMMSCGARIAPERVWLTKAMKVYIDEEYGHEQWILNDLIACGIEENHIIESEPNFETEVMVRYVRDYTEHTHPLGFFGMVHVLEGTSTLLADQVADSVQLQLKLPNEAFHYLRSHGALDIGHVAFFRDLVDQFDEEEMNHVIFVAKRAYRLYGDVLRSLSSASSSGVRSAA